MRTCTRIIICDNSAYERNVTQARLLPLVILLIATAVMLGLHKMLRGPGLGGGSLQVRRGP